MNNNVTQTVEAVMVKVDKVIHNSRANSVRSERSSKAGSIMSDVSSTTNQRSKLEAAKVKLELTKKQMKIQKSVLNWREMLMK